MPSSNFDFCAISCLAYNLGSIRTQAPCGYTMPSKESPSWYLENSSCRLHRAAYETPLLASPVISIQIRAAHIVTSVGRFIHDEVASGSEDRAFPGVESMIIFVYKPGS